MPNRYMTPLTYVNGAGEKRTTKVYFELDAVALTDWTFEHPFEANELRASLIELDAVEKQAERNLTQDEIRTLLGVIKLLADISAGRPTDDNEYFIKDPNWTSSYAYRGFREFLLTNPKEVQQFLTTLLDNDTMEKFTTALSDANAKMKAEEIANTAGNASTGTPDSGEDTIEKYQQKIRELQAQRESSNVSPIKPE